MLGVQPTTLIRHTVLAPLSLGSERSLGQITASRNLTATETAWRRIPDSTEDLVPCATK
jgi:hypothetical protein